MFVSFVVSVGLMICFACSQKKVEPTVVIQRAIVTDTIENKGQTIIQQGVSFVDVEMTISHPRFQRLNEDFGIEPFCNIVRKSTYIAIKDNNMTYSWDEPDDVWFEYEIHKRQ